MAWTWTDSTNKETKVFLSSLPWDNLSEELVMDVGCGMGNLSTKVILQCFPDVGKIIAIDKEPLWIEQSASEFKSGSFKKKVEFHKANITGRKAMKKLQQWRGQISKIVCTHCISFITNQELAFRNMFDLLKPGGQAALLFVIKSESDDVYIEMAKKPKWSEHLKKLNTETVMKLRECNPEYYINMLKGIGFNVIFCNDHVEEHIYFDDEEFEDGIWYSTFIESIPKELQDEFVQENISTFLSIHPRNEAGNMSFKYFMIKALIEKVESEDKA